MLEKKFNYPSANGVNQIQAYLWLPKTGARAVLQICHGMGEHMNRYRPFVEFMTSHGFIVCGNDHAGHGHSVTDNIRGDFGGKGHGILIEDAYRIYGEATEEAGHLPYFLLGHSMGSFIARGLVAKYPGHYHALALSGTSNGNKLAPLGQLLCRISGQLKGIHTPGRLMAKMMSNGFNRRIPVQHSTSDWLSHDRELIQTFREDPLSNFYFTYQGYDDLLALLREVTAPVWYRSLQKDLPVYLFSGSEDPVGGYGKGVQAVYKKLNTLGIPVTIRIYEGGRHEMLNEVNRNEVYLDLLHFFSSCLEEAGQ